MIGKYFLVIWRHFLSGDRLETFRRFQLILNYPIVNCNCEKKPNVSWSTKLCYNNARKYKIISSELLKIPKSVHLPLEQQKPVYFRKIKGDFIKVNFISCPEFSEMFPISFNNTFISFLRYKNGFPDAINSQVNIFMLIDHI